MSRQINTGWAKIGLMGAAFVAVVALGSKTALAQTMGEYGMATGTAASGASRMPAIQPDSPSFAASSSSQDGSTHTEEIRSYEEPAQAGHNLKKQDDSSDSNDVSQDWVQVK